VPHPKVITVASSDTFREIQSGDRSGTSMRTAH
jgi:hypothetical protein